MKILVKSTQKEHEPNPTLPVRQDIKLAKKKLLQSAFKNGKAKVQRFILQATWRVYC